MMFADKDVQHLSSTHLASVLDVLILKSGKA